MQKLSAANIDELYLFTRKHFVEHYDLQTELVDHLAKGIEAQWEENSRLSFEQALQIEFKKYGVFGFSDVVGSHNNALQKKYFKIIWQFLKEYFKLPKIVLTLLLSLLTFCILQYLANGLLILSITLLLAFTGSMYYLYRNRKIYNAKVKHTKKRWKLEEMIFTLGDVGVFFSLIIQLLFQLTQFNIEISILNVILAPTIVITILLSYIAVIILPENAENILQKTHPEYRFVN